MKTQGPSTADGMRALPCGTPEIDLLMLLYGEVDGSGRRALEDHARGCPSCSAWMAGGRDTLELVTSSGLRESATLDAPGSWADLRTALAASSRPAAAPAVRWRTFARAAAVLLLAGASFTVGRLWNASGASHPGAPAAGAGSGGAASLDSDGRLRLFSERTNDYLDRSRMVLLELANGDMGAEGLSLSQASRRLLQENPAAREVAREIADRRLQDLVSELESILGQISRLPDSGTGHVDRIRTYVNNSGVLEQLELLSAAPSRMASDRHRT